MRLSVSNIAWDPSDEPEITAALRELGVDGIEVAPTKLWPDWVGATSDAARSAGEKFDADGFSVPALQAILFGKSELQLFGSPDVQTRLIDHIQSVAGLAEALGAKVLVFGSPKNRHPGERTEAAAQSDAQTVFHRLGDACAPYQVKLCIEPNPKVYACRFMTSWRDVLSMVDSVDHDCIGLHLDAACIQLEGDDVVEAIAACAGRIAHFHVTEPELGDFSRPQLDHAAIGRALQGIGYEGWLSIEMRRSENPVRSVTEAVTRVREWYG